MAAQAGEGLAGGWAKTRAGVERSFGMGTSVPWAAIYTPTPPELPLATGLAGAAASPSILKQAELAQLGGELGRQLVIPRRQGRSVRGRFGGIEIAPALKGPPGHEPGLDQLAVELDRASRLALAVGDRLEADDALAHPHIALDHPVERAAVEDVLDPLRHHAGDVPQPRRPARLAQGGEALLLPFRELLDSVDADAELDDVNSHCFRSAPARSKAISSAPSFTCSPGPLFTFSTRPSAGAVIVCSIFIASRTRSGVPRLTMVPAATRTWMTLPGMGAARVPASASSAAAAASGSRSCSR